MLEHKGYLGEVEFDDESDVFHGRVINIKDVITFVGTTPPEIRREFRESVEDYLAFCAERGEKPEKPFSGKFFVRMSSESHRDAFLAAKQSTQKSFNAWVCGVIEEATGKGDITMT